MNKISIITINYNDAIGLEKTVQSVIKQNYAAIEYIVIDGNSTDGSKEIMEKYRDHFAYSVSEKDSGIYNAMNKGIKASTGDYLLFMNSGDVLIDDADIIAICQQKLSEDIVAFDCYLEKDNQIVGRRTHDEKPTLFYVYKNGFKHQSTFIKRKLFEAFGLYDEQYRIAGDYEFWVRCFMKSSTTSKSYTIPIAIFQLGGISQNSDWVKEHKMVEKEWLGNILEDFKTFEKLMPHKNSRLIKGIIKMQQLFKKSFRN